MKVKVAVGGGPAMVLMEVTVFVGVKIGGTGVAVGGGAVGLFVQDVWEIRRARPTRAKKLADIPHFELDFIWKYYSSPPDCSS